MTPDEFLALPPSLALRVLLEVAPGLVEKLKGIPVPKVPRPPRYDFAIRRKDGTQWASETDVEGLTFWRDLYQKGADKGGQYAAKDAKKVKQIDAFIAWRRADATSPWSGERNDEAITARPPSGFPRVYPRAEQASQTDDSGSFENGAAPPPTDSDFSY